jgi:hypothetical protein
MEVRMENTKRTYGNIWKISCITFCFVAFSLLGASYVFSKCESVGNYPTGSFSETCKDFCYDSSSDTINARCNDMYGKKNRTQIQNAKQCKNSGGDISNCNGMLQCTGVNLPNVGSYKKSCWCCKMVGNSLTCYCNPKKGKAKLTMLDNAASYSDIWNDNGALKGK